jgi:hypothetical protein
MLFRFPNADSFAGMGAQNGDFTHVATIGQKKLQQLVGPTGFRIERFESEIIYPRKVFVGYCTGTISTGIHEIGRNRKSLFFCTNVVAVVKRHAKS